MLDLVGNPEDRFSLVTARSSYVCMAFGYMVILIMLTLTPPTLYTPYYPFSDSWWDSLEFSSDSENIIIAPLWKSGAILDSPCPSVIPWFRGSVIP